MSLIASRDDLETAAATVKELGFDGMEVHTLHIAPGISGEPVFEGHAAAAGEAIQRAGLMVSTFNVVGDDSFDPFSGQASLENTIDRLAEHLRWADAMGSPRVLIWDGRVEDRSEVPSACRVIARVIESARDRCGISDPPSISCKLHPFTFALQHQALNPLAETLLSVEAGICFDFCHFGVALGQELLEHVDDQVVAAIDHIHYSDTDTLTSALHFPPGEGVLDLHAISERLYGKPVAASWDLSGWPEPRYAVRSGMESYRKFVQRLSESAQSG